MFHEKSKISQPHNWLIHHYLVRAVKEHSASMKGRVLDIGCGTKPYRELIEQNCEAYIGLDKTSSPHGLKNADVVGDAQNLPFRDESFDWVVSFQVMEHLAEPQIFLSEAFRVLKRDGYMLITTPFMWGEHEQPNDYYRYTRFGLKHLSEKAGFKVISIVPNTGYWTTAVLRFNYWLNRFARGPLKYLFAPIWLNQYLAILLDRIDKSYTADTSTFTTLLRKPL